MRATCIECGREYGSNRPDDLCPRCRRREDQRYANDPRPMPEQEPWEWSIRRQIQERLGVSGDTDD